MLLADRLPKHQRFYLAKKPHKNGGSKLCLETFTRETEKLKMTEYTILSIVMNEDDDQDCDNHCILGLGFINTGNYVI